MPDNRDCNLLFGLLALQLDFIGNEELISAAKVWISEKSRPLDQVICDQKLLSHDERELILALVDKHLELHGHDLQQSLAAVSSRTAEACQQLTQLGDQDVTTLLLQATVIGSQADCDETAIFPDAMPFLGSAGMRERFRILRQHAKGGLGQVSVAIDTELNREVALKEIQPSYADHSSVRSRFEREAEITGSLEHPGVVPVYGLGKHADGRPYYAMRLIRGDSLKRAVDAFHAADKPGRDPAERSLELRRLLDRFLDVCNAVDYAHSRGIIHRDIKPDNVMLGPYGETLVVDWGLCKVVGRTDEGPDQDDLPQPAASRTAVTRMGSAMGTPAYMSPEQAAGRVDQVGPSSDVYSLGATLYYLLTGAHPLPDGDVMSVLRQAQSGEFKAPREIKSSVPAAMQAICLHAMARAPSDRYETAGALAEDIRRWLADEPVSVWKEPWAVRWGRRVRRHARAYGTALAISLVASVVMTVLAVIALQAKNQAERARRQWMEAEVDSLRTASPDAVRHMLRDLADLAEAIPIAERMSQQPDLPEKQRIRLQLALLQRQPERSRELQQYMLSASPDEFRLVCDALRPYADTLVKELWSKTLDEHNDSALRFRSACALASYDPHSPAWKQNASAVVSKLVASNVLEFKDWIDALRPVKAHLISDLALVYRNPDPRARGRRVFAANVLADYAFDQPQLLWELVRDADQEQFAILFPVLANQDRDAVRQFSELLNQTPDQGLVETETFTAQQANAAIYLVKTGNESGVWEHLKQQPDPRLRSLLIHRLHSFEVDASTVLHQLQQEQDVAIRRALLVGLGEYDKGQLSEADAQTTLNLVARWYREDSDPGIHAAARWLMQQWESTPWIDQMDEELRRDAPTRTDDRQWYYTTQGQTMVIVPGPSEFLMGSPESEVGRDRREGQRLVRIEHSFALSSTETTLEQFHRFRSEANRGLESEPGIPATFVSWYEAAEYCNWLSQQEGIPSDEWCYPVDQELKNGVQLADDFLTRTGYRLPTEAEWELACRAGTRTSLHCGDTEELLDQYAWYAKNSLFMRPVALLKPNDLGLFDTYGNVYEWCHDRFDSLETGRESPTVIMDLNDRVLRGGSYGNTARRIRSAFRLGHSPAHHGDNLGFRVARSLRN